MKVNTIEKSFLNISGEIFDSEYINLANIDNGKISFGERTLFLTKKEKEKLNSQKIKEFNTSVYIFSYKNTYGMVCDIPISEYEEGNIKCHELVLPDTIQGMLSNLHGYNCETAPVLLGYNKSIDYVKYIERNTYSDYFKSNDIEIYVFCNDEAEEILKEFSDVNTLYVADGHHRLYSTSLSGGKNSILSCLISFDYLNILPIHRIIPDVDAQLFDKAKEFIYNRFNVLPPQTDLSKGKIRLKYNKESFVVDLIELNSDAFWNNDIYRLNTQIISQAFRIFDTGKLKYISDGELNEREFKMEKNDVLIETHPIGKGEFTDCANNNCIMPPKSTWFFPKFPSFLILKQYK